MEKIVILASNNKYKLEEISKKLAEFDIKVIPQREAIGDLEVEETGTTFAENAILKAEAIYKIAGKPVIADDSGLAVDYLNGEPGVYSNRFAGPNATDDDRINKIIEALDGVEDEKRTARFICSICYVDENGEKHVFENSCEGIIAREKHGDNGFGYDPIFMVGDKSFAEISKEDKNKISHRGKAIADFVNYLKSQKV